MASSLQILEDTSCTGLRLGTATREDRPLDRDTGSILQIQGFLARSWHGELQRYPSPLLGKMNPQRYRLRGSVPRWWPQPPDPGCVHHRLCGQFDPEIGLVRPDM